MQNSWVLPENTTAMKSFILSLLIFGFSILTQAQSPKKGGHPDPQKRALKATEKMTQELGLTDLQKPKVLEANQLFSIKLAALRADTSIAKKEKAIQRKALVSEHMAKLKGILTPEQYSKLEAIEKERKAKAKAEKDKKVKNQKSEKDELMDEILSD